jgi:hypothetical protein
MINVAMEIIFMQLSSFNHTFFCLISALLFVVSTSILFASEGISQKPSVLFCTPLKGDVSHDWVDWVWLQELEKSGFEVDVTEKKGMEELTWKRIKDFNVIFLFATEDALLRTWRGRGIDKEKILTLQKLITRYAESGGGIMMMPTEVNIRKQCLADLTTMMDIKIPVEKIVESDSGKIGMMNHMPVKLAWTDNIEATEVSKGIKSIWYPYDQGAYNSQMTCALDLSSDWQVVVRASKTSYTKPHPNVSDKNAAFPPRELEGFYVRNEKVTAPPIFAIRDWQKGRVAFCAQWRQFSVGSGTQWIFNREVLSSGLRNRPSDFNMLIKNTLQWLAQPSMNSKSLGGYKTVEGRLLPKNYQKGARENFDKVFKVGNFDNKADPVWPLYKGIIGVRSEISGYKGSIADYAKAAKEAGLAFVVFLEDINKLNPALWKKMSDECTKNSDKEIILYPGITGKTNAGNYMFVFGQGMTYPPENCFRKEKDGTVLFYQQAQDSKGRYQPRNTPLFGWLLDIGQHYQIGYYDFAGTKEGMEMQELRLAGMAAVQTWRNGKKIEEDYKAYLETASGTLPPTPASIHIIDSPEILKREVKADNGLMYAQGENLKKLFKDALHFTCQYDGVNAFPGGGPLVKAWPSCSRAMTFGAEEAVSRSSFVDALLDIESEVGLKEIAIYNGDNLFRRFLPNGKKRFTKTLILTRTVQKTLVAVATDMNGEKTVSVPHCTRKSGSVSPEFCHDHVNDMIGITMARGPFCPPVYRRSTLPNSIGGWTWDGGPKSVLPFEDGIHNLIVFESSKGKQKAFEMIQYPKLLAADELFVQTLSDRKGVMYSYPEAVYNPWRTFGPSTKEAELFTCKVRFAEWSRPVYRVTPGGHGFGADRHGIAPAMWQADIVSKTEQTVKRLDLFTLQAHLTKMPASPLLVCSTSPADIIDLQFNKKLRKVSVPTGEWFALYSFQKMNPVIFFNQGEDLLLEIKPSGKKKGASICLTAAAGRELNQGDILKYSILSMCFPMDIDIRNVGDIYSYVNFLADFKNLQIENGSRKEIAGLAAVVPENGWINLKAFKDNAPEAAVIPVEIRELNPRWTTCLLQEKGYSSGYYGSGENRWRELAVSSKGLARFPLYAGYADETDIIAGHPLVAGEEGESLFIKVIKISDMPVVWHVSVNNPTDKNIETELKAAMPLSDFNWKNKKISIKAGQYQEWEL